MTHQLPIESKFASNLENALCAEVAMGTVTCDREAIEWLSYTYLHVRMMASPLSYGVSREECERDCYLIEKKSKLIENAAMRLHEAKLMRVVVGNYYITELGRIASRYYIDWETIEMFQKSLRRGLSDSGVLKTFACAKEFENLKLRDDEVDELERLKRDSRVVKVPVDVTLDDNVQGKVVILLEAYISRAYIESFSLISDTNYINQNASRVIRAMFETSMTTTTGMSELAGRLLEWCKMVERRVWHTDHILRHFCYPSTISSNSKQPQDRRYQQTGLLNFNIVDKLESKKLSYNRIYDMNTNELTGLLGTRSAGESVQRMIRRIPNFTLKSSVRPITNSVMRVTLEITPDFEWSDNWHSMAEPYRIWVENLDSYEECDVGSVLHAESYVLAKKQKDETQTIQFAICVRQESNQYLIRMVSDRWVGVSFEDTFAVRHLLLPGRQVTHTRLLNLTPLPIAALNNREYESLFKFPYFNPIQTQIFHTVYHSNFNVLLGAPTGSGKTIVAELAMFRLFQEQPAHKVVYIAPMKALARERMADWKMRLGRLSNISVVELTGDFTPDLAALENANVVITTPEKWDGISRHWRKRGYVRKVGLVIIDEIHLLGQDRGPILEVIVSRMRYISSHVDEPIRFIGLSTALANAHDVADWLGIGAVGLYNFQPSVRPVPLTVHVTGFPEKHYCPRMATMNKPAYLAIDTYSPKKPVLIFVSSRRQTRLTANDIGALAFADGNPEKYLNMPHDELLATQRQLTDPILRDSISYGIGMHHAGLKEGDRKIVEELFLLGRIQVLVATSTLAWGVNFPAHLVIIKGTEYFDGRLKRYVDCSITDVLQMMGRAGRPQFDTSAVACVFLHEPKKNFYKTFLYEPFPVESSLADQLADHINAEVVAGSINNAQEAIEYIMWTYLFRRLVANPGYYDPSIANDIKDDDPIKIRARIAEYLQTVINKCIDDLLVSGCITTEYIAIPPPNDPDGEHIRTRSLESTKIGSIASYYYLKHETIAQFVKRIRESPLGVMDAMKELADCPEYDELPVRHNEDVYNTDFSEICPLSVNLRHADSPSVKCFLLLQGHIFQLPLPIVDYALDTKSVLDQSIRILQAMIDIAAHEAQLLSALHIIILNQCLIQATHPGRSSLYCLPRADDAFVKRCERFNITDLPQLLEMEKLKQQVCLY
eukprot:GHVL01009972.1.p1 GENE.GHVL01009972.1~~GHVL01009972.1.p1  ORF type:complete len:1298 (-),score=239.47 GHVL01009972.1:4009-7524(-)